MQAQINTCHDGRTSETTRLVRNCAGSDQLPFDNFAPPVATHRPATIRMRRTLILFEPPPVLGHRLRSPRNGRLVVPVGPRVEHDCLLRDSEMGRFRGVPRNARVLTCYLVVLHHLAGYYTSSEVVQRALTGATLPNRCRPAGSGSDGSLPGCYGAACDANELVA